MSILSGVGAAGELLKGASSLVHALKQPKVTDEAFSEILKARLQEASSPENRKAQAAEESARFMRLRDVNGDGRLGFEESGMERAAFGRLDSNHDGLLTRDEYQQALLGASGVTSK